jgi:hypothetical protein
VAGKSKAVPLVHPAGRTSATGSNAPTKTQAHIAAGGKNKIGSPIETSGARGGHAIGTK